MEPFKMNTFSTCHVSGTELRLRGTNTHCPCPLKVPANQEGLGTKKGSLRNAQDV